MENWLNPHEREIVIETLLKFGLIKFDNNRKLPLKKGGTTDIYINLRDARSHPEAIKFISQIYENPLVRLRPDRFIEVPSSMSCFAGPLSISLNIPMITIRDTPKEGRVSKSLTIGDYHYGEDIAILDDVITDGGSKISPIRLCLKEGLGVKPLVVLVDRQQGWKKLFLENNIDIDVWSGMTLHHIRRYLIEKSIMERCNQTVEEKNPLIVSLDGNGWETLLPVLDQLRTTGCILKVNDLLLWEGIKKLIPDLQVYGRVMADLKGHDISNTLENISRHLLPNPPWAVTVHGSGGEEMMKATVGILKETQTKVLAVTLLTSIREGCEEVYNRRPIEQVEKIAEIAHRSGAHGLVCSSEEVNLLKSRYPKMTMVTPGIRSDGVDKGDQLRVGTPRRAIDDGSDYLVMGRQIFGAKDPVVEVNRLLTEELKIF